MDNELLMPITQELYDDLMAGRREDVRCRISEAWVKRLVSGLRDDQEARELAWPENRGRLQCALALGRLRFMEFDAIRLVAPMRTAYYEPAQITIEPAPDNTHDIFIIGLGRLVRIDRNFG